MPDIIEDLKPAWVETFDAADMVVSLMHALGNKPTLIPREYRIYAHLEKAHQELLAAMDDCCRESPS